MIFVSVGGNLARRNAFCGGCRLVGGASRFFTSFRFKHIYVDIKLHRRNRQVDYFVLKNMAGYKKLVHDQGKQKETAIYVNSTVPKNR